MYFNWKISRNTLVRRSQCQHCVSSLSQQFAERAVNTYNVIITHCILNRLFHIIYWKSPISILGTPGYEIYIFLEKNGYIICKQWRPCSAVSDLGMHCLPVTLLRVSRLQWDKLNFEKTVSKQRTTHSRISKEKASFWRFASYGSKARLAAVSSDQIFFS